MNDTVVIRPLHVVAMLTATEASLDRPGTWCSTSSQDRTVAALLSGRAGFFIELGASHPVSGSNTRSLERDHGWHGLCVEANPRNHNALLAARTCHVVAAAVSDVERPSHLLDSGATSRLFTPDTRRRRASPNPAVHSVTLSRLLSYFHAPRLIDYLSLDVRRLSSSPSTSGRLPCLASCASR
jgi:hypothetical protein